ncbi:MAG: hypothetical protein ACE5H1_10605 [Thermodesulfobacteriota bacterium]
MVNLEKPEDFTAKFQALGPSSQEHFILCFNRVWLRLLDINATGEEDYVRSVGTILGSNKMYKAIYSRDDDKILVDIIDPE